MKLARTGGKATPPGNGAAVAKAGPEEEDRGFSFKKTVDEEAKRLADQTCWTCGKHGGYDEPGPEGDPTFREIGILNQSATRDLSQ